MKNAVIQNKSSGFKGLQGIDYFDFEEDFVEKYIRCIPMIVRFKLDAAGIKLKLDEWSRFNVEERIELAIKPCRKDEEAKEYNHFLAALIKKYTGRDATPLAVDKNPAWADKENVPDVLGEKLNEHSWHISKEQWKSLSDLQRFALVKLCREGHESKNFPKAVREFGLT
jgi:hypothetical protein